MWNSIVLVPDYCLCFYFLKLSLQKSFRSIADKICKCQKLRNSVECLSDDTIVIPNQYTKFQGKSVSSF